MNKNLLLLKELLFRKGKKADKKALNKDFAPNFAEDHINLPPQNMYIPGTLVCTPEYVLAHSGQTLNWRMREGYPDEDTERIFDMLANNTTDRELVLYRGIDEDALASMEKAAEGMDADLYDEGFVACSLVKGHEVPSKVRLRILVPAGTHCKYLADVNGEQFYYEVCLQSGSRFKYVSMDKSYITVRLLGTK